MIENFYLSHDEAAQALVATILGSMAMNEKPYYIALSGGKTAEVLFHVWQRDYAAYTPWQRIHFLWVDERCVPPASSMSNFKAAYDTLLSKVEIPTNNYFRIIGEAPPDETVIMYSALVKSMVPMVGSTPCLDYVLLGIGEDGHTSSIFPDDMNLLASDHLYSVTKSPYDGSLRVGMTARLMVNARHTYFFVLGEKKREIVDKVLNRENETIYPASFVWNRARDARIFASFS